MDNLLNEIIKQKTHCYFVSPHFDDAILSCGNLISYLSQNKVPVTVINVFTKSGEKNTLSAYVTLIRSGYRSQKIYYKKRNEEDRKAMKKLQIKVINLHYVEALWRQKSNLSLIEQILGRVIPELIHTYPTYKFHIQKGNLSRFDNKTIELVKKDLSFIEKNALIFGPMGVGNHVDHVVVNKVCKLLKKSLILWADFPYVVGTNNNKMKELVFKRNLNKNALIKEYKTQVKNLFPNGIPQIPEYYQKYE